MANAKHPLKKSTKGKQDLGSGRREFLRQVATVTAAASSSPPSAAAQAEAERASTPRRDTGRIQFPRRFEGAALRTIAFPLGGVGTGSISLGGRGQLRDWEIFNRPDKGNAPYQCFVTIRVRTETTGPVTRILEERFSPPYTGESGLESRNLPGMPRIRRAVFTGEFPFACIDFEDSELPVKVRLEAFNPFVPLDTEASGLPIAVLRYRVWNTNHEDADVSLAFNLDNPIGRTGRTNTYREDSAINGLLMSNPFLDDKDPLNGTFAAGATAESGDITHLTGWRGDTRWPGAGWLTFWDDFSEDGRLDPSKHMVPKPIGSVCTSQKIPPNSQRTFTFVLAWHFPNRTPERCGWQAPVVRQKRVGS